MDHWVARLFSNWPIHTSLQPPQRRRENSRRPSRRPSILYFLDGSSFFIARPSSAYLEPLQARTAVTLFKYSYNFRMQYLRKILPERFVDTEIFSKYDDKIDEALLNTGVADDREELRLLRY